MPTIFITGSSSGLGHATARLFADKGWRVVATMRTPAHGADLAQLPGATVLPLDVTDPAQIKATVAQALALGDVDVVFNNAGYMLAGPLEGATEAQLLREVNTNLLGVVRVTQAFLPHFREKQGGLFLITTSVGAWIADPFMSLYQGTKRALEGWSEGMYFELSKFGIGIKTIVPGFMKTDLAGRSLDVSTHDAYDALFNQVVQAFTGPGAPSGADPATIAEVVWEAATDGTGQLRYFAGAEAQQRYARLQQVGADETRQATDRQFFPPGTALS